MWLYTIKSIYEYQEENVFMFTFLATVCSCCYRIWVHRDIIICICIGFTNKIMCIYV